MLDIVRGIAVFRVLRSLRILRLAHEISDPANKETIIQILIVVDTSLAVFLSFVL